MARRIRVPGLVDLVLVADSSEIRALNEDPRLDRRFLPRGPLVNWLIAGRIRRWFQIKGQPLPSLAARGDPVRAERQQELAIALDPASGRALWSEQQLDKLASFVRGIGTYDGAAITVQEITGRLFDPLYAADPESWRAATLIDRFRKGFSPVQIIWQITGRLRRARALLVRARQTEPLDDAWDRDWRAWNCAGAGANAATSGPPGREIAWRRRSARPLSRPTRAGPANRRGEFCVALRRRGNAAWRARHVETRCRGTQHSGRRDGVYARSLEWLPGGGLCDRPLAIGVAS